MPEAPAATITEPAFDRVALVVHPTRDIDAAVATLRRWTSERGLDLVQLGLDAEGRRRVAPAADAGPRDLVVAVGGDGTVLAALRAGAAAGAPVLGVACGSLGALSAISEERLGDALERLRRGDWTRRRLPALAIAVQGGGAEYALNDFAVVRRGTSQLAATVTVDNELYVRLAGDGLVVATALGSTAYSMAAGGPILAADTPAFVCTPLAMHGGSAPPLVVPAGACVTVDVIPGHTGFGVEIDGHSRPADGLRFRITLEDGKATLVTFDAAAHGITAARGRRLVSDSPRILARDDRAGGP